MEIVSKDLLVVQRALRVQVLGSGFGEGLLIALQHRPDVVAAIYQEGELWLELCEGADQYCPDRRNLLRSGESRGPAPVDFPLSPPLRTAICSADEAV